MSTRCQVLVEEIGTMWKEEVMLYHHMDGYPKNILPLIFAAFKEGEIGWEKGRAGKVASFLCAVDPGEFEPESGFQLHGDIEWYYRLRLINSQRGSTAERPVWMVDIYKPGKSFYVAKKPTITDMQFIVTGEIGELARRAEEIEDDA
jgi:hypothetical protein